MLYSCRYSEPEGRTVVQVETLSLMQQASRESVLDVLCLQPERQAVVYLVDTYLNVFSDSTFGFK